MFPRGGLMALANMLGLGGSTGATNPAVQSSAPPTGTAGGPAPQLKSLGQTSKEELAAWQGYDPNSEKTRMTQYANAYNQQQQPGSQPPAQTQQSGAPTSVSSTPQTAPTTQASTPQEGGLWGKMQKWGEGYQKRMEDRGLIHDVFKKPEEMEKPWSINEIPDDQWHNREMGIMFDPNDPEMKDKMLQAAMNEGKLDPERYQQISRYQADVTNNPYYQSQRDKYYKDDFGANPLDSWLGKLLGVGDKNINLEGN